MDAGPLKLVDLITQQSSRLVVPVYQRPYSWDKTHCEQLWSDILLVARRGAPSHFTGSVVWVQEGTMSASGITPRLVIDGQQRLTTVTLLITALARYARSHTDAELSFSVEEIIDGGYLVNKYKKGDDHYRLTLSQGDRDILRALVDNAANPETPLPPDVCRLTDNLAFFEERLACLDDVGAVWQGLHRLEVVSISLTQGQDNPQLIFESMNSTGKDLACADLVRNFVLMGQTADEQADLYTNYWRPIEKALGVSTDDAVFDRFIRCWLTIARAPEIPSSRDVYKLFKQHAAEKGLDRPYAIKDLLSDLCRAVKQYANVTLGGEADPELRRAFADVAALDITVTGVLLVYLYGCYEDGALTHDDLVRATRTVESYTFRRLACDIPTHGLNKFFPSLVARLKKARNDGRNLAEALAIMLMGENGTQRRFPSDGEFAAALRTRNAYGFKKARLLLARLENSYHPKAPHDFFSGTYTIEHIMPQAALDNPEWKAFLGENPQETFETHIHTLGNLTLTAYNSELSDCGFAEKKKRVIGGFDNDFIVISQDLKQTDTWTPAQIEERGARLAALAIKVWPAPALPKEAIEQYKQEQGKKPAVSSKRPSLARLVELGGLSKGTVLYSASPNIQGTATLTPLGKLRLDDGVEYASPSTAFRALASKNGYEGQRNGWVCWRVGSPQGELLDDVRKAAVQVSPQAPAFA